MLTLTTLQKICTPPAPLSLQYFVDPLNKTFTKYEINSKQRIAAFLSQVLVESGEFKFLKENLNYSVQGLLTTFPKYFTAQSAIEYAHNQQAIASKVYANRLGNGDEASHDGYTYRGRGLIQITGKAAYVALAHDLGMTLENIITYMETVEGATISAGWFWNRNNLNALADAGDITAVSKKVNGGTNGLQDRIKYYNKALSVLE
jgi:putative chitinase